MPPELAAKMQYDINRWQRGASDCNRKMPAVAASPAVTPSEADEATADALAGLEGSAASLADPSRHAIAVRSPIDLVGGSLTRASSRQSTDATADSSAGPGTAGRGSDAEAEKPTEGAAADDLTLPACISRIVPRKGVTRSRRCSVSGLEIRPRNQQGERAQENRYGFAVHVCFASSMSGLYRHAARVNPTLSPMTVVGPMGSGSGLAMSSFWNSILLFQTFRRKSSNTWMVSCSPGQRR